MQKPTSVSRDGKSCWSTPRWTSGSSWSWSTSRPGARGGSARARGATRTARCRRTAGGSPFESDETGRPEVYVTPFPGPGRTWPISTDGGRYPEWRGDGREIVYAALDGRFLAVPAFPEGDTFRVGAAAELFRTVPPQRDYRDWGMSPDGQRFAIVPPGVLEAKNELRLIVNWPARMESR